MQTDHQLIKKVLNNHPQAFATLTERYQALIYRIALDILTHAEEAQNAVQETWMQAYTHLHQLQSPELFKSWICRIGRNTALKRLRHQKRSQSLDHMAEQHPLVVESLHSMWAQPPKTPEELLEEQERHQTLFAALGELPEKSREALVLFYIENFSYREIATSLNLSTSAVQSRLQIARQRLRNSKRFQKAIGRTPNQQALDHHMHTMRRSLTMQLEQDVQTRYERAVATFSEKLQQEHYVLAAIVYGSLSYDEVWEKSDVDLWVIVKDDTKILPSHCLIEDGIIISASLIPRNRFKNRLEGERQGGWRDFAFARSRLLFSKDDSIKTWYEDADRVGQKDRELQVFGETLGIFPMLAKAEKWFYIKKDLDYSFLRLLGVVEKLAKIETIRNHEAPGREVIAQALRLNPELFDTLYTDLIKKRKTESLIHQTLETIDQYLEEKIEELFKPLLDYLSESEEALTLSDLNTHFKTYKIEGFVFACEWLVEKDILTKTGSPAFLTPKSRLVLEEPAYAYDPEEVWI